MFPSDDEDENSYGIRRRRYGSDDGQDSTDDNAAPASSLGITPRAAPPVQLEVPETSTIDSEPETPVKPLTYSDADLTRSRAVNPQPSRSQLQADEDTLAAVRNSQPKKQSRGRALLMNMLYEMGQGANQVTQASLMTGRPVDQYGIASIVGRGLGGAGRGLADPAIMNKRKREFQMQQLSQQIAQQLEIEKQQSESAQRQADARWLNERGAIEAGKQKRISVMQQLRLKKGQLLDPERDAQLLKDADAAGISIDPKEWNSSKDNYATLTLTDPDDPTKTQTVRYNKVTGEQEAIGQKGFQQPVDSKTGMTAAQEANLNQRQKEFAQRMGMSEKEYSLRVQTAKETERHHLETEKAARTSQGIAVTRIKIGYGSAKARAKALGISFPDYETMLGDMGVDVVEDDGKKK